jgi:hypothetical protein
MAVYSSGEYGAGSYNIGGAYLSASVVSASSSGSVTAVLVKNTGGTATGTSATSSPTPIRVRESGALAAGAASTAAVGYDYNEEVGYRTGYGLARYGIDAYGTNPTVVTGSASASVAASATATAGRTRNAAALVEAEASGTGNGVYSITGAASLTATSSYQISYIRIRNVAVEDAGASTVGTYAREKWEPITNDSTTWTKIAA